MGDQQDFDKSDWIIRRAIEGDHHDAAGIANAFEETYGGNYPWPEFLDPDEILNLMADPDIRAYVIEMGADGTIAGTGSLVFTEGRQKAELGRTCIRPTFRGLRKDGKSAFNELVRHRTADAWVAKAKVLFVSAVTSHRITQAKFEQFGYRPCAFELGKYWEIFERGKRESTVTMMHQDSRFREGDRLCFASRRAGAVIRKVCGDLGIRRHIEYDLTTGAPFPQGVKLDMTMEMGLTMHAIIKVVPGGVLGPEEASRRIIQIQRSSMLRYVQVQLPSEDPITLAIIPTLEDAGYHLSGWMPDWYTYNGQLRDVLVLQVLNDPSVFYRDTVSAATQELIETMPRLLARQI